MSAFLGPIHYWLYNKIQLMENMEKAIIARIDTPQVKAISTSVQNEIVPFLPEAALDQLIDTSNIHGWLQEQIINVETRQALLIKHIADINGNEIYDLVNDVYTEFGKASAKDADIKNSEDMADIFNKLNNYLLEGMPCDRVNQVIENSLVTFIWETSQCVHTKNWSVAEIPVERYYEFRASFINGFVKGVNSNLSYKYTNNDKQLHVIKKEIS